MKYITSISKSKLSFCLFLIGSFFVLPDSAYSKGYTISLAYSETKDKKESKRLYGSFLSGKVFIFVSGPTNGLDMVRFWIDDPQGKNEIFNIDKWPPFDLLDRRKKRRNLHPRAFDTTRLINGSHTILTEYESNNGSRTRILTPFSVDNN